MVQMVERLPSQRSQLPLTSIILSPTLSISKLTKTNLYRNKNNKVDKFLQGCHHQHKEDKQKLYQSNNNNIQYQINQAQEPNNRLVQAVPQNVAFNNTILQDYYQASQELNFSIS